MAELTVAQRVNEIARMMTTGQWGPMKSSELATIWGLEESAVRKHAAEASRLIVANMGPPEEVRGKLLGMLDEATDLARQGATEDPLKAGKLIVDIIKQHAVLAGVNAPQKLDITVASAAKLTEMSVEDLRAIARGEQPAGAGSSTP